MFEAVSHPLRIKILELLAKRHRSFSELKKALGIESSGKLSFHLKKLGGLIALDSEGKYTLTREGYAAFQAVITVRKYGWQKRAYILNIIAYVLVNIYAWLNSPSPFWFTIVFSLTTAWILFYSYWCFVKRKIHRIF